MAGPLSLSLFFSLSLSVLKSDIKPANYPPRGLELVTPIFNFRLPFPLMEWILLTAVASITNIQLRGVITFSATMQRRWSSPREINDNPTASSNECREPTLSRGSVTRNANNVGTHPRTRGLKLIIRGRKIAEPAGPPGRMTKFESLVNSNENTDGFYASARVT